jgi:hypothetical protein
MKRREFIALGSLLMKWRDNGFEPPVCAGDLCRDARPGLCIHVRKLPNQNIQQVIDMRPI